MTPEDFDDTVPCFLCVRVSEATPTTFLKAMAAGNSQIPCAGCGSMLFVAPSSIKHAKQYTKVHYACKDCIARALRERDPNKEMLVTRTSESELTPEQQVQADALTSFMNALDPDQLADLVDGLP